MIRTVIRETGKTIRGSRSLFVLALCITSISFFVLSIFVFLTINLFALIGYFRNKIEILVFLEDNVRTEETVPYVQSIAGVETVRYVSPEEALEDLRQELGAEQVRVLEAFERSPIPPSLRVKLENRYKNASALREISRKIGLIKGVSETVYGGEIIDRIWNFTKTFILFDFLILTIIIFSVIFAVAQTIKMTILVREQDIEVMQLVGASEQFIRLPFTLEGLAQGVIGGLVSFVLITGLYGLLQIWTPSLIFYPQMFFFGHLLAGGFFGLIGASTAINRSLK